MMRLRQNIRKQRGTTFIIVLGILSLLALIASTMTYSTRLDVIANGNIGGAVQRQISGLTGVPRSAQALSSLTSTIRFIRFRSSTTLPLCTGAEPP